MNSYSKIEDNHVKENYEYLQVKKNTVSAQNQLDESKFVRFVNSTGKGKRIMFVGNSITLHGVKEDIGWINEHGMAASCKEKDYVHLCMNKLNEKYEDAVYCICQVARWECNYKNGSSVYNLYEGASGFGADIIVCRFIENCTSKDFDAELFKNNYKDFVHFLDKNEKAKIVFTTGFYKHPGDGIIKDIGKEYNMPVVYLGDLGEDDSMKAIGKFEHSGVANHPGDKGMQKIAERIVDAII